MLALAFALSKALAPRWFGPGEKTSKEFEVSFQEICYLN
jgi:hypothetical protein